MTFLLHCRSTNRVAAVDPADGDAVIAYQQDVLPDAVMHSVLITHRHWDHAGGNSRLHEHYGDQLQVVAPAGPGIDHVTTTVGHNDEFLLMDDPRHPVRALHVPCHTVEHVVFHLPTLNMLFSGDTLFVAGCGRFFEGTGADMLGAMDLLSELSDHTEVFCGHEYTLSNYAFAASVDPTNAELRRHHTDALATRAAGLPTVPTTIGVQKATNPFMRVRSQAVVDAVAPAVGGTPSPVAIMTALRKMKDNF